LQIKAFLFALHAYVAGELCVKRKSIVNNFCLLVLFIFWGCLQWIFACYFVGL